MEFLPARLVQARVVGLSWVVLTDRLVTQQGAWGFADLASRRAMEAGTPMATASVTKTFTAALLMQQVEQGRCSLDDAADRHLTFALRHPLYPTAPVTLRHLLTHTSGLSDDPPSYLASYACGDPSRPMDDWLQEAFHGVAARARPPFHAEPPGTRHEYSNVGFGLLGLVLERLSRRRFDVLLKEDLLGPLGMKHSFVLLRNGPAGTRDTAALATPYEAVTMGKALAPPADRLARGEPIQDERGYGQQALCAYGFATQSDGLVRSSAVELAAYARALLQGGQLHATRVLREDSVRQMFSHALAGLPTASRPARYEQGLAWRGLGAGVWAHFGSDPGAAAAVALRPQDGGAVILLANSSGARPLMGRLVQEWMSQRS
jgi:CubicO group peptidase (beta-lactamase class C family)